MLQERADLIVLEVSQLDDGEYIVKGRGQFSGKAQTLQRRIGRRNHCELAAVELRAHMIEEIFGEFRRMFERRLEFIQAKHDAAPAPFLRLYLFGEGDQVPIERLTVTDRIGV